MKFLMKGSWKRVHCVTQKDTKYITNTIIDIDLYNRHDKWHYHFFDNHSQDHNL